MAVHVTEGIVLQKTDYSETSLIIKVFTFDKGLQSFIYPGAKRKNKKGNLISPLATIQLEYYHKNEHQLGKITKIDSEVVYKSIPFDPIKSSIVFFLNEVIINAVKEEQYNPELYHFLKSALHILDLLDNCSNFALRFLLEFTKHLGFYPIVESEARYFDLLEGKFTKYLPAHPNYIDEGNSKLILAILGTKFDEKVGHKLDANKRRELTYDVLKYYQIIFDNFKKIKSLPILEVTFHD